MLKENKKMLEHNCLLITKFEREIWDYKQTVLLEFQAEILADLILGRQKEIKKNRKLKCVAISSVILPIISINHFCQFFHSSDFVNDSIALILLILFALSEAECYKLFSTKFKSKFNHLIETEYLTQETVKELLLLSDENCINALIEESYTIIEEKKKEIAELEEIINVLKEDNEDIRKLNRLKEKVLNDKLIKQELESEFKDFLTEKTKPENIRFDNELEKPLKLVFTNK